MSKIRRIARKELRKNELFEVIQKIILYIKENPKRIKIGGAITGGALLVLLIANFLIKRAINTPKEELAQNIFSYHYSQDKLQSSTAKEQFLKFLSKHKRGLLSDIALLYKGVLEKDLNDYGTASETFSSLLKKKNNIISSSSLMNLANIEEEKGNYKKAIEYYKMLSLKDDYLKKYAKERINNLNKISSIETLTTEIGISSTLP